MGYAVKLDTNGGAVAAFDVNFKVDSPLTITAISKNSPATGGSVMSNPNNLSADFSCTDGTGAAIVPDSSVILKNININKTRTGIIGVMLNMGANIEFLNIKQLKYQLVNAKKELMKIKLDAVEYTEGNKNSLGTTREDKEESWVEKT